jgi:hypothetical protein
MRHQQKSRVPLHPFSRELRLGAFNLSIRPTVRRQSANLSSAPAKSSSPVSPPPLLHVGFSCFSDSCSRNTSPSLPSPSPAAVPPTVPFPLPGATLPSPGGGRAWLTPCMRARRPTYLPRGRRALSPLRVSLVGLLPPCAWLLPFPSMVRGRIWTKEGDDVFAKRPLKNFKTVR